MTKIKEFILQALALGAAVFAALFFREKSKRLEVEKDQVERESEALSRINEAALESERQFNDDIKPKPVDRDHFKRSRRLH